MKHTEIKKELGEFLDLQVHKNKPFSALGGLAIDWMQNNRYIIFKRPDGMTNDEAALYLEYGPRIVELLKEIIQLGHSNSDKYCNCPDCNNAIKIKKVLALIGNKS